MAKTINQKKEVWWVVAYHYAHGEFPWERWGIFHQIGTEEELQRKKLEFENHSYCEMCNDYDMVIGVYNTKEEAEQLVEAEEADFLEFWEIDKKEWLVERNYSEEEI